MNNIKIETISIIRNITTWISGQARTSGELNQMNCNGVCENCISMPAIRSTWFVANSQDEVMCGNGIVRGLLRANICVYRAWKPLDARSTSFASSDPQRSPPSLYIYVSQRHDRLLLHARPSSSHPVVPLRRGLGGYYHKLADSVFKSWYRKSRMASYQVNISILVAARVYTTNGLETTETMKRDI